MKRLVLVLLLLLLPACGGLPLPEGVRDAGPVSVGGEAAQVSVVAAGPTPGTTASALVSGYLFALSKSPQDGHTIARQYLAPDVPCCGSGAPAVVYELGRRSLEVVPGDESAVRVKLESLARIDADGAYRPEAELVQHVFRVVRVNGELRLSDVPDELWLLAGDVERTFTPYDVHFLGRAADGGSNAQLVPDRVFLRPGREPAQALVDRLLLGPTDRLEPAVLTAAPAGTTARAQVDGSVVTVQLSAEVRELDARARQRLSAQLVWTLGTAYTGVRLRVGGGTFEVEGAEEVQDRSDWQEYDPAGVPDDAPLLYVRDRRVGSLDSELAEGPASNGDVPVDEVAQSPATGQLGVRTRVSPTLDEIRTGPVAGPLGDAVLSRPGLGSLSWGSGERGLWAVQRGTRPLVWLVPPADALDRRPRTVPYEQPGGSGPLTALQVSRDGARAALVLGGRLHVGLVVPTADGVRIADVVRVSQELGRITDVGWESGTSLVAVGSFDDDETVYAASVAADGSDFAVVQRPVPGTLAEVAVAPRRPRVVAADDADGQRGLYRDNGTLFRLQQPGRAPAYPG